ncbi:hypothetical protein N7539_009588 [Penicillium diatomitis]|uniref:Alpha-1,3-mannosyltransferase n=1 Tax=Penicillium diatomitis TaxID=2819901 RepID=A0A9X0BJ76_9EURO|nr:uncharacterized protein N7539_009588 [Penicillium diatomitis]KAJ5466632.1 hypothetical protein N7539_009588 [Penicillium diatomitis]
MYEPTLSPSHHRRVSYPRRKRISLQIALLLFILGYLGRTALYSLENSRSQACPRDSITLSKEETLSSSVDSGSIKTGQEDSALPRVLDVSSETHQSTSHAEVKETRPDDVDKELDQFVESLENVLLTLPDPPEIIDTIGPIEGTGEIMVREIGLRARLFKSALDAWEALQTIASDNRLRLRGDVLQQLMQNPEIATRLEMDHTALIHKYEEFHSYFVALSERLFAWTLPYFPDLVALHAQLWSGGKGIVLTGGNHQASYLLTSIQSLRDMGCELPIEVMYLGDEDLGRLNRRKLEKIKGVITRDLSPLVNDRGWKLKGWALKPFAIMLSSFREAIFIDADSLFLRDPSILFLHPDYQRTGALFFKDRIIEPASKLACHMQESGVVVVDKWKHFVPLMVITRLNGPDRDGNAFEGRVGVYDMVFGDKETFWLGFELVGDTNYAFHDGKVAILGVAKPDSPTYSPAPDFDTPRDDNSSSSSISIVDTSKKTFSICAPQLLHLDVDGRPLWFNGWLLPSKFSDDPRLQPVNFTSFIVESADSENPSPWEVKEDNVLCLSSEKVVELTLAEKESLDSTVRTARKVGAIG